MTNLRKKARPCNLKDGTKITRIFIFFIIRAVEKDTLPKCKCERCIDASETSNNIFSSSISENSVGSYQASGDGETSFQFDECTHA